MKNKFSKFSAIFMLAIGMMVSGNVWGKMIYLEVSGPAGDPWAKDNAYFQILGNGESNNWIHMNKVDGEDYIYGIECTYTNIRFERRSPNWEYHWNYSVQMDIPADKNMFTITNWNDNGNNCQGTWSTYTPVPCNNPKPSTNYYIAGQGFPNISWDRQSITMKWDCDLALYYYTFSNLEANTSMKYRFKINPSTVGDWSKQMNAANSLNNNHDGANLTLKSDNEDDRITFDLAEKSDVTIYTDGSKIWAATPGEPVEVIFKVDGSEYKKVSTTKGAKVSKPTDPTKGGYNFLGWSETDGGDVVDVTTIVITAAKTFYAKWGLKGVESVTLDKETLKLVEKGTTGTIAISTLLPSDVLNTTATWTSDNEDVATVNNGVVTPVGKGTATITCTVQNTAGSASATCAVTVKSEDEDCEMVWKDLFNGKGEIANAFNPEGQSEPATITRAKIRIGNGNPQKYAYDNNGVVHANNDGDYWYIIDAGKENNIQLYYFQNATTGKYMTRGEEKYNGNSDWWIDEVITAALDKNNAKFKWYEGTDNNNPRIINRYGDKFDNNRDKEDYHLHRKNWTTDWMNYSYQGTAVACGRGANQGGDELNSVITGKEVAPNPNYKAATVTKDDVTYYRFAENGTMTCTLTDKVLKVGDKISVYCYNTASSTVAGELRIGSTKVADISLAAGVSTYEYTIAAAGGTQIVVATSSPDFCVARMQIEREEPDVAKQQVMAWDTDLRAGITAEVNTETITHTATAKGAGVIAYSSSDTEVATVNAATGEVTKVGAGNAVITASVEQEGCYETGTISYTLTLTDLPKPTIAFTTVPTDAPQGSVQTVVVTTTGGADFDLAITDGEGATLTISEKTATSITATLAMGAEATDIELTATTKRVDGQYAQATKTATVAVGACFSDGADIFNFTFTSSSAASAQTAEGIIGGSVDQTALGTKGTEDNPAIVAIKKLKFNNQFVTDVNSTAQITTGKTDHSDEWYMYPAGTYDNKQMYYLKNVASGQWLYKDKSVFYGPNGGWKYYAVRTSATNAQTDVYKWMEVSKDNKKRFANRESYVSNDHEHTHNMRPCITEAANEWKTPYVGAGLSGHQGNQEWDSELVDVENVANPDMIKSVEHNSKNYYIISSEGKITINCDLKAGDVITLDMYNRQTKADASATITISEDATKYEYTTTNEYLCIHGIIIHREKVGEFITPTLSFAEANVTRDLQNSETSYTQVPSSDVTTVATMTYASDNDKATVDANGNVTLDSSIEHGSLITITATLPAVGCYNEATASYTIRVKNIVDGTLQNMIDATPVGETLVLEDDFIGQAGVVDKAMTIDAQGHEIGNLTLKPTANVTLSSALKVADLTLWANENENIQSAQLTGEANLTIGGDVWFDVDFEAGNAIEFGWYTVAVPFTVDGVYYKNSEGTRVAAKSGKDYMLYTYDSNKRAAGQNGWTKYTGNMNPGMLYLITMDDALGVSTFCFKKANGATIGGPSEMTLQAYSATNPVNAGWNGVANSTLQYRNVNFSGDKVQVYSHADDAFHAFETADNTFVVGSAFFAQSEGETLKLETPAVAGTLLAPTRSTTTSNNSEWVVELTRDGKQQDRVFLSAEETASETYEIGHDLVKMAYQTPKVAQVAIAAYGVQLCDAELPWSETNEALFPLTLTAPQNGTYTLHIATAAEGTLYLLHNGQVIWNLSQSDYDFDLTKGKNTEYSLMLQRKITDIVTTTDKVQGGLNVEKFIRNNRMYILKNNTVQDVLGK